MSYLDVKYISLVSSQLPKFAKKKENLYNFRCPYCGDSKKRQDKARGYLFKIKNDYVFKCHNCGVGRTFTNFLKDNCSHLHDQYVMERYRDGLTGKGSQTKEPKFNFTQPAFVSRTGNINLEKISDLDQDHPARVYLEKRKIKDLNYFYYCPKFKEWTNTQKQTFESLRGDSPRIILPLYTAEKELFGYQGRSLSPTAKLRYITILFNDKFPKVFGLDRLKTSEPLYITEGPFDSMFLNNSIAMLGSDLDIKELEQRYSTDFVFVYDNEPRNKEIVNKYQKIIDNGNEIVIWPSSIEQKDINDMVLAGLDVNSIVKQNKFKGLQAKVKLNAWKKV